MKARLKAGALLMLVMLVLTGPALAQEQSFFAGVELPTQFNFGSSSAESVSGFVGSFAFPFNVGVGFNMVSAATHDKSLNQDLTIDLTTFDVFLHFPSDLWIWAIGTGTGTASYSPNNFTATVGPVSVESAPVAHYFGKLGFRITAEWAAEASYHRFTGESDVKVSGLVKGKSALNAGMYSLGASYAF